MARPQKEIDLVELEKLCAMQCTDEEIAAFFDVTCETIRVRKKQNGFSGVYTNGKGKGKISLRRLQWKSAQNGNVAMQIWLGKQLLGQKERAEVTGAGPGGEIILHVKYGERPRRNSETTAPEAA